MWYRRFSDPEYNDHCGLLDVHDRVDEYFSKTKGASFPEKFRKVDSRFYLQDWIVTTGQETNPVLKGK